MKTLFWILTAFNTLVGIAVIALIYFLIWVTVGAELQQNIVDTIGLSVVLYFVAIICNVYLGLEVYGRK